MTKSELKKCFDTMFCQIVEGIIGMNSSTLIFDFDIYIKIVPYGSKPPIYNYGLVSKSHLIDYVSNSKIPIRWVDLKVLGIQDKYPIVEVVLVMGERNEKLNVRFHGSVNVKFNGLYKDDTLDLSATKHQYPRQTVYSIWNRMKFALTSKFAKE